MLDLSDIATAPEWAEWFTIQRSSGLFILGGWQDTITIIQVYGTIQPAKSKDLEQCPEGDRVKGAILIHSPQQLYITRMDSVQSGQPGLSDIILWRGDSWRLAYKWDWDNQGFDRAIGIRMAGG